MSNKALVDSACTQTTANDEQCFFVCGKVHPELLIEVFDSLLFGSRSQVLTHRITCEDDFFFREEALHTLVCHADFLGIIFEQFVGHSSKSVLLLQQDRHSHLSRHFHGSTTGVAPYSNTYIWTEVTHNLACLTHRTNQVNHHANIAPWTTTVKALDRQTDNLISCLWHALHFHTSECSHEENFAVWIRFAQCVCNTYGRKNMPSCSATRD